MRNPHICDACHGAKKKCDAVSSSCTRCTRLNIPCTGRGQTRYRFKEHFANAPYREKTQQDRSRVRLRSQTPASPPEGLQMVVMSPPQTRQTSTGSESNQQAVPRDCTEALARRFSAAVKIDEPRFDLSGLASWLAHVPERLGTDDVLDKAALAFMDAFDCLQSGSQVTTASPTYEVALMSLESALQDEDQVRSPHSLAAVFMLNMAQEWTFSSAKHYMNHMACICQLLNDTAEENCSDPFARSVRLSLIRIVCIESIINPSLAVDGRCLQGLKYESGLYLPLDEEAGQAIESLELPFLLRLSQFLRKPEEHYEEIRKTYIRLKTEWPFTRRRYRYIAGISKIAGIKKSGLVQPGAQLGIAHMVILGISLVLNACLAAMDPTNTNLREDALDNGREAVELSRELLQEFPKGMRFTPVALFTSWIATDDPDITYNFFSTAMEYSCYWSDPAYIKQAKTLKEQILQLRAKTTVDQKSGAFQNSGLRVGCGTHPPHLQGNQCQDAFPLLTPDSGNQFFDMDSRAGACAGQLSPLSDIRQWSSGV